MIINHTHTDVSDTSTPMKGAADKILDRNYATGLLTKGRKPQIFIMVNIWFLSHTFNWYHNF